MQNNKRSLAGRRDNRPAGHANTSVKKNTIKISEQRGTSIEKTSCVSIETDYHEKKIKYEQKYRNKNLSSLSTQLLITFSSMTTLNLANNNLSDQNAQLIMNSCTKLTTLSIEGNRTHLIPYAIAKLQHLVNFRHDWVLLNPKDHYEGSERLMRIMIAAKNTTALKKIEKYSGIDFLAYCHLIIEVVPDKILLQKIEKSECSPFAKQNMLKVLDDYGKGLLMLQPKKQRVLEKHQKFSIPGCLFGNKSESRPKEQRWKQMPHKQQIHMKQSQSETLTDTLSTHIIIEDIRELSEKQVVEIRNQQQQAYHCPGMPLHYLFATFDKNYNAPAQIDGLLLGGYNPNIYDQNGLSPFHTIIIYKQKKGLLHLIDISSKNPGFFDLEMISMKESRNILHYSVFLKNYQFTKMLIEFGLPVNKRDATGSRIIHLVDQNYQFLLLLRKLLRKKSMTARSLSALAVPHFPSQNKKFYTKYPQRQKDECKLKIVTAQLDTIKMYEDAVGVRGR